LLVFGSFFSTYRRPDISCLNGNVLAIYAIMLAMLPDVSLSLNGVLS